MVQSPLLNPFVNLCPLCFPQLFKRSPLGCLLPPACCVDSRLLKQEEILRQQTRAELLGRPCAGERDPDGDEVLLLFIYRAEMDSSALMFEVVMAGKGLPFL